jgi:uncharacterized protein YndB with AHSA1/START domain
MTVNILDHIPDDAIKIIDTPEYAAWTANDGAEAWLVGHGGEVTEEALIAVMQHTYTEGGTPNKVYFDGLPEFLRVTTGKRVWEPVDIYDGDFGTVDIIDLSKAEAIPATSDKRTSNNVLRHEYRVLSDAEKASMKAIKDKGLELLDLIESCGNSRELSIAKTKTEEAVMWAVKSITK